MPSIGGRTLGVATGTIKVDVSQIDKASSDVKKIGSAMKKSLDGAGDSAKTLSSNLGASAQSVDTFISRHRQAQTVVGRTTLAMSDLNNKLKESAPNLKKWGEGIKSIRGELAAVGVAGAVISKIGLDGAKNIRNYQTSFKSLLGSEQEAITLMKELTGQANEFGIEVEEVWQLARALLPALEGDTDQLDEFVTRAALLASTNPLKGTADAARAIQEYLSGQTISIQRLFNIDPNIIAEAQTRFADVGDQLDYILERMGATEDGAREMADSWVGVKNEMKLLLAEGFTPLFQALQPALTQFREFVSTIRESSPAVATFGAGLAVIAAVGGPTLIFLGQMVTSAQSLFTVLKAIQATGALSSLAKLGASGGILTAAAVAGGIGGSAIGRGIGRATGNEEIANTTLDKIPRILQMAAVVVADGASKLITIIVNGMLMAAQEFSKGVGSMVTVMGAFVRGVASLIPGGAGEGVDKLGADLEQLGKTIPQVTEAMRKAAVQGLVDDQEEFVRGVIDFVGLGDTIASQGTATTAGSGFAGGMDEAQKFADEQIQAITAYYDQLDSIEDSRRDQRLAAEESYQDQRASIISDYNRTSAREEQDFLRSRTRQNQQFARDVAAITEERIKRESDWLNDLNSSISEITTDTTDKIAELREDGNERIQEIEETYNDQREQAARQHANTLLSAASRLDAGAIAEEQRRYALQTSTAETEFSKRVASEKESLNERIVAEQENAQERIQQEWEAHAIRISEARIADEERLADMREALALQQRQEDEDRAIRLQRTREDHRRQLAEMQEANRERLIEINKQAALEKTELRQNFKEQLLSLGIANDSYLKEQEDKQKKSLELFEDYWGDWEKVIEDQEPGGGGKSYASGGVVDYTGNARVHGTSSKPEYMLNADTTSRLQAMMGNFNQSQLLSAVAGGGGSNVNLGGVNFSIQAAAGMSPNDVASAVESKMISLLRSLS